MPTISLITAIDAPIERVFDLARSIDAHQDSTDGTDERAIEGVTSGLIGLNQKVTWEAKHFGVRHTLSVEITAFERPILFEDRMIKGPFKSMTHTHRFEERDGNTVMRDLFVFSSPLWIGGWLTDRLFLKSYMMRFISRRNSELKEMLESDRWKSYLK